MIAPIKQENAPPEWHAGFLAMLPVIRRYARGAFLDLNPENRAEAVADVIASSLVAYVRLFELGKVDLAYPTVLARYGIAQYREGRRTGVKMNCKDVSSSYSQQKKGFGLMRLDRYDRIERQWLEVLVEDRTAGPADIAATRMDFSDWLKSLTRRQRKIATTLAGGESTKATARKFKVSEGRISQVRRELKRAWDCFVREKRAPAAA
jgi:hypothetical protein